MGKQHAATGMIAGLLTYSAAHPQPGWQSIAYVCLWGGAALIPDWDHASANPTIMWGPVSELLTAPLRQLPGGHRWATHDLVLATTAGAAITWVFLNLTQAITTLATDTATYLHAPWWVVAALPFLLSVMPLAMLIGLALKVSVLPSGGSGLPNLVLSMGGAWWLIHHPAPHLAAMLPMIVAGGIAVHILGDALTVELVPVPILWIFTRARFGLPLFEVNSRFERHILAPLLGLALCALTWRHLPAWFQNDLMAVLNRTPVATHPSTRHTP